MRCLPPLAALLMASAAPAAVIPVPPTPATETVPVTDSLFGTVVADPYRWLENDVRGDAKVRDWVTRQNAATDQLLAQLPLRAAFKKRMTELYDYERFGVPVKRGGRYFYTRNDGLQNQSPLYVRDSLSGAGRLLIDPNSWSKDGATALAEWAPSDDGRTLLYTIQDGGTDWRTVRLVDVGSGKTLPDELKWVKFSGFEWLKDGSGFFYSRYPEPPAGATFQSTNENSRLYFHTRGTPQSSDRLIHETPDHPKRNHYATVTDDGRWLVITTSEGTDSRYQVSVVDLSDSAMAVRPLITKLENRWDLVGNVGAKLYFATDLAAPLGRVVTLDATNPAAAPVPIVAQDKYALDSASMVGGRLILSYLADAKSEIRRTTLAGKPLGLVALPGIGTASGFGGKDSDPETFFAFTSFNRPTTIYRLNAASGAASVWEAPKVKFDPDSYDVRQVFVPSKDGTKVPAFIIAKKGLVRTGGAPTILYGYGGFDVSLTPAFSPTRLAWLDAGGVYVSANLRGGGEYGKAWHDAGRLANKQNVFDDFIAVAEWLKAEGITGKDQLAVAGGSNGGLLVGAVVNQRPDLFAAATPAVGVMDMLRFDRFTAGRYWVDDYGYPGKAADFRTLLAYSPYHNIKGERPYPAVLVTTADTDDRVVPGHSFKYIAALQAAPNTGDKPHLIRIETRAGHGSGKPVSKIIEEASDVYAFLGEYTGLKLRP